MTGRQRCSPRGVGSTRAAICAERLLLLFAEPDEQWAAQSSRAVQMMEPPDAVGDCRLLMIAGDLWAGGSH